MDCWTWEIDESIRNFIAKYNMAFSILWLLWAAKTWFASTIVMIRHIKKVKEALLKNGNWSKLKVS